MRSQVITLVILAASIFAIADADAKPRRVVVADFDGPRRLADGGRAAVMSLLGEQYSIVATKIWDDARARNAGKGPLQWRQASKQAGVDAVIEGWVQPESKHHVLTILVREAATGRDLDTLSVRIKDDGVTPEATQKLSEQLDDVLTWIDGDINADPKPTLPDVRTMEPMIGSTTRNTERTRRERYQDEYYDEDVRDESSVRRGFDRRGGRRDVREEYDDYDDRDDRRRERRDDRRPARDERRDERRDDERRIEEPRRVDDPKPESARAIETKDTHDLVSLFGPESKEATIVTEGKITRKPQATPKFQIAAGPYVSARGMTFTYDPETDSTPPEYPGQTLKGFTANASVYPMPLKKVDGELSGLGFSLGISKSVLSVFSGMDETGYGDYTLDHTAWQMGIHYRQPVEFVTFDADASFGNFSHKIIDLPESIQIPDTSYSFIGLGGRLDLKVTEGTTVGFGARYMYLLGAGDILDQDWYGAGKAWGATLDGNFVIPITSSLYVKGEIEYRRVKVEFEGSGMLTEEWGVWDVVDSAISGTGTIGVKF